ncbi:hypothetical protein XAPC_3575 [Xanthomonas citri pv. punicae str. LMG 859]|nr:hypothetical protein XAPC_3575 [Xanthomonas citri pv. punicae str. LMG 859]
MRCQLQVQRNRSRLCRRRAGHCASGQREECTQQRPGSFHACRGGGDDLSCRRSRSPASMPKVMPRNTRRWLPAWTD